MESLCLTIFWRCMSLMFEHLQSPILIDRNRLSIAINKGFFFNARREARFLWQRYRQGWAFSDVWNIDTAHARYMCGALEELKSVTGTPSDLTHEDWCAILDEMKNGFCYYAEHRYDISYPGDYKKDQEKLMEKLNRSMNLLKKWYGHLWW